MDEIVIRLARTLACHERLRILSLLVENGELTATAIGERIKLSKNVLSAHLSKLATVGLIKRRRSAGWLYCSAESPYGKSTLSGTTLAALQEWLASPRATLQACGVRELRNDSDGEIARRLYEIVFEAATAFTDLRRLQILRQLVQRGEMSTESLRSTLKMSPWAAMRHTDKLLRRGYITRAGGEGAESYRLGREFKTPIHARLWRIVQGTWQETALRSS
jgi:DNA-binding transcriptional ArsR family regulator